MSLTVIKSIKNNDEDNKKSINNFIKIYLILNKLCNHYTIISSQYQNNKIYYILNEKIIECAINTSTIYLPQYAICYYDGYIRPVKIYNYIESIIYVEIKNHINDKTGEIIHLLNIKEIEIENVSIYNIDKIEINQYINLICNEWNNLHNYNHNNETIIKTNDENKITLYKRNDDLYDLQIIGVNKPIQISNNCIIIFGKILNQHIYHIHDFVENHHIYGIINDIPNNNYDKFILEDDNDLCYDIIIYSLLNII